ncbi:bifunctional protein GlmU [Rubritalea halochordaticola]|uniref:Bifunctional protein GlmU n=1 Tax=Rubritalea halochordaticola TaxID=714537 RepID=A0ABP9UXN5_9BACT
MNVLDPYDKGNMWPLTVGGVKPDQFIAGTSLEFLQSTLAPANANLYANAWVSAEDWTKLSQEAEGTVLVTKDGDELAWIGADKATLTLESSEKSLLIRYPWHLITVNEQVVGALVEDHRVGEVSPAAHIEGVISVGAGTRILPGVFIEGNVIIGENCKIGPNCYIRGNTTIGDGVHVGQAVEIKNSLIGHKTSIGHLSYVGDSVIGHQTNLGAGTITSNLRHDGVNHRSMVQGDLVETGRRKFGTIIGDGVHTGIHTAIYPGRKLGPGTSTRPNGTVQKDLLEGE